MGWHTRRMASTSSGRFGGRPQLDDGRRRGLLFVGAMLAVMWVSEILDSVFPADLDANGIAPRELSGLDGVLWAPFLHDGFEHLVGNTVPFLILGVMIALSGVMRVVLVTLIVGFVSGVGTWLIAPEGTIHVGASGLVFGFAAYLIARWLYTRRLLHVVVGVLVMTVWGATLLSGLVPETGISWQGHLFGALGGLAAAWILDGGDRRRSGAAAPTFSVR